MTPTDKPCLPGCREDSHLRYGEGGVEYLSGPIRVVTGMIHAPNCPNAPNAPKEPAAPATCQHGRGAICETCAPGLASALERINKPAPLLKPEAESVDFEAANFFVEHLEAGPCSDCPSYLSNLGRAYLALRAELAAKDEKLRGLDYLYGELGNQNSFLRAELAEAKAEINRYNAALRDLVGDAALLKDQLAAERLLVRMQSAEAWTTGPSREASEAATAILAARAAKGGANG